jgi:hypothetical protein
LNIRARRIAASPPLGDVERATILTTEGNDRRADAAAGANARQRLPDRAYVPNRTEACMRNCESGDLVDRLPSSVPRLRVIEAK